MANIKGGFTLRQIKSYDVRINGKNHVVDFIPGGGKYKLYVDGDLLDTYKPAAFFSQMFGDLDDYRFDLDGANVVVAVRFANTRIAVNGKYIDDGSEFKEVIKLPYWGRLFVAALIIPPFVFDGTFFDYIIALCCAYVCTHYILKNPDFKGTMKKKTVFCTLLTLASWIFFVIFAVLEGRMTF